MKSILSNNYRLIREWYKYYAGVSPWGIIPGIGQNAFNEIINATNICDNKKLKLADIDFEFIVTKAGNKKKALNPERWLIRYQFMEIFVRLAIHKYFKQKVVSSQSEAINKMFSEDLFPFFEKFDCHKWRVENLWNFECENVLIKYHSVLQKIFNKYSGKYSMPGRPKFMSIEEFITLITISSVLWNETSVGNGELGAQFNLSMATQINEIERDRHLQMMYFEFTEALARVASKIHNFPNISYESLFKEKEERAETPPMMRNRGSSVEGESDEEAKFDDEENSNNIADFYYSDSKPLYVKLEITIKILQLWALENNDLNALED